MCPQSPRVAYTNNDVSGPTSLHVLLNGERSYWHLLDWTTSASDSRSD